LPTALAWLKKPPLMLTVLRLPSAQALFRLSSTSTRLSSPTATPRLAKAGASLPTRTLLWAPLATAPTSVPLARAMFLRSLLVPLPLANAEARLPRAVAVAKVPQAVAPTTLPRAAAALSCPMALAKAMLPSAPATLRSPEARVTANSPPKSRDCFRR
jgi:hypothetical protein